jgi:uncharacterized membrane protein
MVVIAVLGLALASYLVYVHYSGTPPACTAGDACLKVQTSVYSKIAGVPVALIGLIGYIGIFLSLLVPDRDEIRLKTICEECATSAVLMLLLFLAAAVRYVLGDPTAPAPPPASVTPPAGPGKRPAAEKLAS